MDPLEPIPATSGAFRLLGSADESVERDVRALAELIREVVPSVVGVSLTFNDPAMTFTLAVSDRSLLPLDAAQYLDDGPCVAAVRGDEVIHVNDTEPLDEQRWSTYARASAHYGVRSSLSIPVHLHGAVVGGLNVYAAETDAFDQREARVAELVQAPAGEAIRDADLTFTTRHHASRTLQALEDQALVDIASGILAAREEITIDEAVTRLATAASRAGVPVSDLARLVIDLRSGD